MFYDKIKEIKKSYQKKDKIDMYPQDFGLLDFTME